MVQDFPLSTAPLRPPPETAAAACFHCGTPCLEKPLAKAGRAFCCQGCLTVFELLTENGLAEFYNLADNAGVRVKATGPENDFAFLDAPPVRERMVHFSNGQITKVLFRLPAIHCIACVWLLENLFRLKAGIGQSQVNFPRQEVTITFQNDQVKLSEVVALLTSLGYEPDLKFSDLDKMKSPVSRRLWLQLGWAGFAFGNVMLLSISSYLGFDGLNEPGLKKLFGGLSFLLALPVFFYSAADYWKAAWASLRQRRLAIEVPIAAGIFALFGQSVYEVFSGRGEGYFDSLAGLLFFLLLGKLFQQKTYARLAFDRDYKSFFPLSVRRVRPETGEERVSLSQLETGDRLWLRHGELLPADARLVAGDALMDYSFVTGESEAVPKKTGELLYAGGRQIGGAIEVETTRAVSQSYLTALWNQEVFQKGKAEAFDTLTNVYSYRFTKLILAMAFGTALFWCWADLGKAGQAFTAVLIVACPCALALAAPFALGTGQRVLARQQVFLKSPSVIEALAQIDSVVFDKTGTITAAGAGAIRFAGAPLRREEKDWVFALCRQSAHPLAGRIADALANAVPVRVRSFAEKIGGGMEGLADGHEVWLGSPAWLRSRGVRLEPAANDAGRESGSVVGLAINGSYRGRFILTGALRPEMESLLAALGQKYELALLSGDNEKEQARLRPLFAASAQLRFHQSPQDKLEFIRQRQEAGRKVMMVGDGLNDAGALQRSDVGVAVVENVSAFSPASDVILSARRLAELPQTLQFARHTVRVVRLSFLISTLYNIVGISIAASGRLSPVVCAILMPLSSATVVAFACGATRWFGRRAGFNRNEAAQPRMDTNQHE